MNPPTDEIRATHQRAADYTEQRAKFAAEATINNSGKFEIYCITPGNGNGWKFSESVLRDSLKLWDGVESFIDHSFFGQSIRDLGGIIYAPVYDNGIKATLRSAGPSAAIMEALACEMLNEDQPKPHVGFSADVVFMAKDKEVTQILRVYSVDLVFDPARGGSFLRALNSAQQRATIPERRTMSDPTPTPTAQPAPNTAEEITQMREELQTFDTEWNS